MKQKLTSIANEVMDILGAGFKEDVYEKAFAHELRLQSIPYVRQTNIEVIYKGYYVKDVKSDIIVDNSILLELKAVNLTKNHIKQAKVYMVSLNIDDGMVIAFQKNGEVKIEEVEKPDLPPPEIKVEKRRKSAGKIDIEKMLGKITNNIMDYFGTEFMFTDAKFDIYKEALGIEMRLNNLNYHSASAPVLYKDHKVNDVSLDYILEGNTAIYPLQYAKEENIEEAIDDLKYTMEWLNLKTGYIVGFPSKEELDVIVKKVTG